MEYFAEPLQGIRNDVLYALQYYQHGSSGRYESAGGWFKWVGTSPMPHIGERLELDPTLQQRQRFGRAAGCARLAYNWALARWRQLHRRRQPRHWQDLQKAFIAERDTTFPFLREVPSFVYYQAFRDFGNACTRYAKGLAKKPRFKRRSRCGRSFRLYRCKLLQGRLLLPGFGAVRLKEDPRRRGRLVGVTISGDADRWMASLHWEVSDDDAVIQHPAEALVGIDLGLVNFATTVAVTATGEQVTQTRPPRPLRRYRKRIRRLSRRLSRRRKGSARRERARLALARLHRRIRHIRRDFLHQLTTRMVRDHQTIVIEDLSVQNLLKNRRLAPHIADVGWYEFRRQLIYKAVRYQRTLLLAHRFYPSSKRCSGCGGIHAALTLKDRVFQCPHCGHHQDRDINAARNLCTLAQRGSDVRGAYMALVLAGQLESSPGSCLPGPSQNRTWIFQPSGSQHGHRDRAGYRLCTIRG